LNRPANRKLTRMRLDEAGVLRLNQSRQPKTYVMNVIQIT